MHARRVMFAAGLLLFGAMGTAGALAAEDPPPRFFVAPINTEAQRLVVSKTADVYAIVDGSALLADGRFDPAAATFSRLAGELKRLADGDSRRLKLVLRYGVANKPSDQTRQAIRKELVSQAEAAGYSTVSASEMSTTVEWGEDWEPVGRFQEAPDAKEPIVEDRLVKAYPVRTRLTKMVMGDADCVVEIKRPFDGWQTGMSNALRTSVQQAVKALSRESHREGRKGTLLFRVSSTDAGAELVTKLFDSRQPPRLPPEVEAPALKALFEKQAVGYQPSAALKLASELGFEGIRCAHSPGGGAPEKLIGKPVPDFALSTLEGKSLELRKHLRGRPALITFWGVACGPCCAEAPHLTRMHAQYGDQLAIVAVNAYDETREQVAAFVEQESLRHPIVLLGGSVADKQFFVGAYPTTFWVSADGVVDDYEVGFESAQALEERIEQLLAR